MAMRANHLGANATQAAEQGVRSFYGSSRTRIKSTEFRTDITQSDQGLELSMKKKRTPYSLYRTPILTDDHEK